LSLLLLFPAASTGGGSNGNVNRRSPLKVALGGSFRGYSPVPVLINYTDPNTDLLISTPPAGQRVYLVGLQGVNAAASNPRWKSADTELLQYQLSANSGMVESFSPNDPKIICNTEPDEGLYLYCDVELAKFLAFIIEAP
jgi:hypothetical protein